MIETIANQSWYAIHFHTTVRDCYPTNANNTIHLSHTSDKIKAFVFQEVSLCCCHHETKQNKNKVASSLKLKLHLPSKVKQILLTAICFATGLQGNLSSINSEICISTNSMWSLFQYLIVSEQDLGFFCAWWSLHARCSETFMKSPEAEENVSKCGKVCVC